MPAAPRGRPVRPTGRTAMCAGRWSVHKCSGSVPNRRSLASYNPNTAPRSSLPATTSALSTPGNGFVTGTSEYASHFPRRVLRSSTPRLSRSSSRGEAPATAGRITAGACARHGGCRGQVTSGGGQRIGKEVRRGEPDRVGCGFGQHHNGVCPGRGDGHGAPHRARHGDEEQRQWRRCAGTRLP